MSASTYWLLVAPAAMLVLSGIGWVALWITRPPRSARSHRTPGPRS